MIFLVSDPQILCKATKESHQLSLVYLPKIQCLHANKHGGIKICIPALHDCHYKNFCCICR